MPDEDRKARLMALAARAGRTKQPREDDGGHNDGGGVGDNDDNHDSQKKPLLKFRNYAPQDENLDAAYSMMMSGVDDDDDNGDGQEHQPVWKKPRTDNNDASGAGIRGSGGPIATAEEAKSSKMVLQEALQEAQREVKTSSNVGSRTVNAAAAAVDVKMMAPQKIDADLKRGISEKLAKLERRTQRSIVEMLKERLELEAQREADNDDDDDDDGDDDHDGDLD